jgi:hypothetical protein
MRIPGGESRSRQIGIGESYAIAEAGEYQASSYHDGTARPPKVQLQPVDVVRSPAADPVLSAD